MDANIEELKATEEKQVERLRIERLKNYFKNNFNEYKEMLGTKLCLAKKRHDYVVQLCDSLQKTPKYPKELGEKVFEQEIQKVFDEREKTREEIGELNKEAQKAHGGNVECMCSDFIERKLNLIEQELNKNDVYITLQGDEIIFINKQLGRAKNE